MGFGFVWSWMAKENTAYIQQSIGDTSHLLAEHFNNEFEHLSQDLKYLAEVGSLSQQKFIRMNPEIIEMARWKRGSQSSAFDLDPTPQRIALFLNTQNPRATPQIAQEVLSDQDNEQLLVKAALQNTTILVLSSPHFSIKNTAFIAVPVAVGGSVNEVVSAHFMLDQQQKGIIHNGMVRAALVDEFGNTLAHTNSELVGSRGEFARSPLFLEMNSKRIDRGQLSFQDEHGTPMFGGYAQVGIGRLAVLASIPEDEATMAVASLKKQSLILIFGTLLFVMAIGYLVFSYSRVTREIFFKNDPSQNLLQAQSMHHFALHKKTGESVLVTVLDASIKNMDQFVDQNAPDAAGELLNDFVSHGAAIVEHYGGLVQTIGDFGFLAIWGLAELDGTEVWRAVRCGLALRKKLGELIQIRKNDGKSGFHYGFGIHRGHCLVVKMGAHSSATVQVVGGVPRRARALAMLATKFGTDLIISQEVWAHTESRFVGEPLGEVNLRSESKVMSIFGISGYRDEQGQVVNVAVPNEFSLPSSGLVGQHSGVQEVQSLPGMTRLEETQSAFVLKEKAAMRWLVNNGTKIEGPLTASEIALRLFAQELDFDCECWAEGTGESAMLRDAKIFQGSDNRSAHLWIFDGQLVHGPLSEGFLKTAILHGAISSQSYVCSNSTVSGWKLLEEMMPSLLTLNNTESKKSHPEGLMDLDELRNSLAPPSVADLQRPDLQRIDQQAMNQDLKDPEPSDLTPQKKAA
jgi:class 3 adenylate cyclase